MMFTGMLGGWEMVLLAGISSFEGEGHGEASFSFSRHRTFAVHAANKEEL